MNQIESIDAFLKSKKMIFVTGKGGIGKSLLSCVLAKRAEQLGLRVLLVEQAFVDQIGEMMGRKNITHEEQWVGQLGVANFTTMGTFKDFVNKHLMKSQLLDFLISNKIISSFFSSIPGLSELNFLGRLFYASNSAPEPRPDLIIFDAYASGHFLSLMTTPKAVLGAGLTGPIKELTLKVYHWLSDPKNAATVYVAVPEELVISETMEFIPKLNSQSPVQVQALGLNRCLKSQADQKSQTESGALDEYISTRMERQHQVFQKLDEVFAQGHSLQNLECWKFPEVGFVEEPLSDQFVKDFLCGVKGKPHE